MTDLVQGTENISKLSEIGAEEYSYGWPSTDIEIPLGGNSKRIFDIIFSLIGLTSSAIIFAAVSIIVALSSRGPVFFRHERIGFGGKSFACLKFRTMHVDADHQLKEYLAENPEAQEEFSRNHKLKNDPRVIPVIGQFLRNTSLDELPQFINVLCGEMSVVGPRPVTREEIPFYGSTKADYERARPGITGLWQVSGRNDLSFDQRVEIDQKYIRSWSFKGDIFIVLKTVKVLLNRSGAY